MHRRCRYRVAGYDPENVFPVPGWCVEKRHSSTKLAKQAEEAVEQWDHGPCCRLGGCHWSLALEGSAVANSPLFRPDATFFDYFFACDPAAPAARLGWKAPPQEQEWVCRSGPVGRGGLSWLAAQQRPTCCFIRDLGTPASRSGVPTLSSILLGQALREAVRRQRVCAVACPPYMPACLTAAQPTEREVQHWRVQ
ncbi:hypothetical protein NDU88_002105 [Pleurodeles waltl]|uniref:Uncharacterized protein n=1 Tax=Pleurodeles waltl TaxID=8319 RepID=A0AAV7VYF8_PLEWA|nr:hypothetical protein NDU88_002105 [Pleurodeles waltl]